MPVLALIALLAPNVPGAQDAPELAITDELLARIASDFAPAVRERLGVKLERVRVRLGTRAEIEDVLAAENEPILARLDAPGRAADSARAFARALAPALLAKYAVAQDEVLVQAETFSSTAALTGLPALTGEPALRAVVLHELVHAADDERHDLARLFVDCRTADAVRAASAVLEGHAQLVARELAPRLGCAEGFATFSRAITAPPHAMAEASEGEKVLQRGPADFFTFVYTEGETFLAAIRQEGGDESVQRAFRSPPPDTLVISHPSWFLHPEQRPHLVFDLDRVLDSFAQGFAAEEWAGQRLSMSPADLRNGMAPVPVEEIDAITAKMRQNRVHLVTPADEPGSSQIALAFLEFGTPEEARSYLFAYRRLQEGRDELMKEGDVRIVSSDYVELTAPDPDGLLVEKRMSVGPLPVDLAALCLTRGSLVVEAMSAGATGWDVDRLLETALKALDEVERQPRPAETPATPR